MFSNKDAMKGGVSRRYGLCCLSQKRSIFLQEPKIMGQLTPLGLSITMMDRPKSYSGIRDSKVSALRFELEGDDVFVFVFFGRTKNPSSSSVSVANWYLLPVACPYFSMICSAYTNSNTNCRSNNRKSNNDTDNDTIALAKPNHWISSS
jgi:hypothetical protein